MKRLGLFAAILAVFLLATTASALPSLLPNYTASLVADIFPGVNGGLSWPMAELNGVLYTRSDDGVKGRELWKYDGVNPPSMVMDDLARREWRLALPDVDFQQPDCIRRQ